MHTYPTSRENSDLGQRKVEKKSEAGVVIFAPWIERSTLLPFSSFFPSQSGSSASGQLNQGFSTLRIDRLRQAFLFALRHTCFAFSFGGYMHGVAPRPYPIFSMICCLCTLFLVFLLTSRKWRENSKLSAVRCLIDICFL